MAEAVVNQDTGIMAKEPGVFNQAGSLVSQVQRIYSQPAFQRSLPTMIAVIAGIVGLAAYLYCLLYTSPSPRDATLSRMPSSA